MAMSIVRPSRAIVSRTLASRSVTALTRCGLTVRTALSASALYARSINLL
jgi:hypothetical protein